MRRRIPWLLLACLAAAPAAAEEKPPDFAGVIETVKMRPVAGKRKVLAVLWDPHRKEEPAPPREEIERLLFGKRPSVADWFRENSGGKLVLESAGVLGWYDAARPAEHYWGPADKGDADGDGWVDGHVEKWGEAVRRADAAIDFRTFDANHDRVLDPSELGILVVIPQKAPFGTNRGPAGRQHPKWEPLVVDGVRVPVVAEWYTGLPPNLGAPAHELCHLFLGSPDLYQGGPWPPAPCDYSLMDHSYTAAHLDPFEKLKLGWLQWRAVAAAGEVSLKDVETRREALVLHDPRRGPAEYFLLENRWRGDSYDAGVGRAGRGIPADGLAVWHILEDPKAFDAVKAPTGGPGEWGRLGIRLVRANGGTPIDDRTALFRGKGTEIGDGEKSPSLRWLDGTPSGFTVTLLTDPGPEIRLRVGVRR